MRPTTRRGFLGSLAAAASIATAGCSTEAEGPPDGAVHLFNQTNYTAAVQVRVETPAGESLLDETFEVPAGSRATAESVMPDPGEYAVRATANGDTSARTLTFPSEEGGVRGYIRVAVSRDGVLVSRAGLR